MPIDPCAPDFHAHSPLFIVMNGGSGSQGVTEARAAMDQMLQAAQRAHTVWVAEPGRLGDVVAEASRRARAERGALVAAGGDGTLNAVAQAALAEGLPFGVLAQGTFNYFARAHGLPQTMAEATQALLGARVRAVPVGLVNERVFLVNASLGLYPQLLEDREAYKARFGRSRWVALWAGALTVLRAHRTLHLRLAAGGDGRDVRASTLFVGNNALQLEQIGIGSAAALARGQLAAVVLRPVALLARLGLLLSGAFGRLGADDDVSSFGFEQLSVQPDGRRAGARIKVAVDGEICRLRAPLRFCVSPQPLWLLVPATPGVSNG